MKAVYTGLLFTFLIACNKKEALNLTPVSENFEYKTSGNIHISLSADARLEGASFELYTANPVAGGKLFAKGILNNQGRFDADYQLGIELHSVYLRSTYIGLPGDVNIEISNNTAVFNFNSAPLKSKRNSALSNPVVSDNLGNVYKYLGNYNSEGVPYYLTVSDNIDASLLDDINAALPEQNPVPNAHPEYLASGNDVDIHLTEACDVWITFVHEGAGHKNALGFYTYPTSNPPASVNDIDTTFLIFPNTSYSGSGGGMHSGDKVHLGVFEAGTSIGWALVQDGYDPNTSSVNVNKGKFYSNPTFNPETTPETRQHNVQLSHSQRDLVLIGFEDLRRDVNGCDNDFNDAIFYVTSNPIEAIEEQNLPAIGSTNNDQDNDGVDDNSDDYPTDPNKAFDQYYPDAENFSSLAFEDLWPAKGDYDFNDLVVDQQYRFITSANNMISEIELKLVVRHIGAGYSNGFGISFPFTPSQVGSVTGCNITDGLVSINAQGLEANQAKAVIIPFDNAFKNLGDTLTITINLSQAYSLSQFNQLGANPFIFANSTRGREIHLVNKLPTDLADRSYFGTGLDVSDENAGIFYKSNGNYPWALELNKNYKYPKEKVNIEEAYKFYTDWVTSNGNLYKDWYSKVNGEYRDFSKVQP